MIFLPIKNPPFSLIREKDHVEGSDKQRTKPIWYILQLVVAVVKFIHIQPVCLFVFSVFHK